MAVSYLTELMDEENNLSTRHVKATLNILKAEVKGRYINSKVTNCIHIDCIPRGTDQSSIRR